MNGYLNGDYGHGMTAFRLRGLGDDSSTFLSLGFNSAQIAQIEALHASCALSDAGYQALVSGFISPDDLADFLAADPGCPTPTAAPKPATVPGPTSPAAPLLTPGPAPRVTYGSATSLSSFLSGSIAGIPTVLLLGGLVLFSVLGKRR
jgi:hypothetical protein